MTDKGKILIVICWIVIFYGCNRADKNPSGEARQNKAEAPFEVKEFDALSNCNKNGENLYTISLDYLDATTTGFIIPGVNQIPEKTFICKFKILNKSGQPQEYAYKIFYQNESYKFPETDGNGIFNNYSLENFYGSWEDTTIRYKYTPSIPSDGTFYELIDSIRIVGNPRCEEIYYENGINNRWKRNPRVGLYSFLLTITNKENLDSKKIPEAIQNICLKNENHYLQPYYFFLKGEGNNLNNTSAVRSVSTLKVIAQPNLGDGIFVDKTSFTPERLKASVNNQCNADSTLFRKAAYTQFFHYIDATTKLENIPVVADVLKDNYSKRDYNWNRGFYIREELIGGTPQIAQEPCKTVYSDPVNKKITIHNPKTTPGKWIKENVGIVTRHGLSYGKYRVKAKLTEMLNKNNMWNGITNAIWMINQKIDAKWNMRRPCRKEGYMSTYWGGAYDKRVESVTYSEIDFEILKTPPYCPDQNFPPVFTNPTNNPHDLKSWNTPLPDEILKNDGNVTVACTNWDMACWEPENFGAGCNTITYNNMSFDAHRWDHWYRAITEKFPAPDDSLFGRAYYYFEIEWKPEEIIWRIGPEPDQMRIVGYMNDKITSIPDNQMLLIVTQEFHNTDWWPGSPYQQSNIPFPANDIFGEIYEITIE